MNIIPHFASKCLKRTFKNKSHGIASIKYGPSSIYEEGGLYPIF